MKTACFFGRQRIQGRELQRLESVIMPRKQVGLAGKPSLKINLWGLDKATQYRKEAIRFLTELMHEWNSEIARHMREDLGYQGMINAGN